MQKCIGFDATEDHRVKGGGSTYAVGNFNICPLPGIPNFPQRYDVLYPLRDYKFNRARCGRVIKEEGLPIPPKSACFFCPAMRQIEIQRLAIVDQDFYVLAMAMEQLYRGGKHFRGDDYWTVKAIHKDTGEKESFSTFADDGSTARLNFREAFSDLGQPFKYKLRAHRAVPGLGRKFAWQDLDVAITDNKPFESLALLGD